MGTVASVLLAVGHHFPQVAHQSVEGRERVASESLLAAMGQSVLPVRLQPLQQLQQFADGRQLALLPALLLLLQLLQLLQGLSLGVEEGLCAGEGVGVAEGVADGLVDPFHLVADRILVVEDGVDALVRLLQLPQPVLHLALDALVQVPGWLQQYQNLPLSWRLRSLAGAAVMESTMPAMGPYCSTLRLTEPTKEPLREVSPLSNSRSISCTSCCLSRSMNWICRSRSATSYPTWSAPMAAFLTSADTS